MNKTHLTFGLLVAVILVAGAVVTRPGGFASSGETLAAPAASGVEIANNTMVAVNYTGTGFVPPVITVKRGDSVVFVNASGKALRIAPVEDAKDGNSGYLGFLATKSIGRGETFGVSLTKPGIWGYKNLKDPNSVGIVIVK